MMNTTSKFFIGETVNLRLMNILVLRISSEYFPFSCFSLSLTLPRRNRKHNIKQVFLRKGKGKINRGDEEEGEKRRSTLERRKGEMRKNLNFLQHKKQGYGVGREGRDRGPSRRLARLR